MNYLSKKNKIFCEDCRHFKTVAYPAGIFAVMVPQDECRYVKDYESNPMYKKPIYADPKKDNKDNNCKYFERR